VIRQVLNVREQAAELRADIRQHTIQDFISQPMPEKLGGMECLFSHCLVEVEVGHIRTSKLDEIGLGCDVVLVYDERVDRAFNLS
jgi:hypothetical protein